MSIVTMPIIVTKRSDELRIAIFRFNRGIEASRPKWQSAMRFFFWAKGVFSDTEASSRIKNHPPTYRNGTSLVHDIMCSIHPSMHKLIDLDSRTSPRWMVYDKECMNSVFRNDATTFWSCTGKMAN
jgi:hypothetical protein